MQNIGISGFKPGKHGAAKARIDAVASRRSQALDRPAGLCKDPIVPIVERKAAR